MGPEAVGRDEGLESVRRRFSCAACVYVHIHRKPIMQSLAAVCPLCSCPPQKSTTVLVLSSRTGRSCASSLGRDLWPLTGCVACHKQAARAHIQSS